jgi:predicted enzyme related to lactoylglutathione lyase
MFYKIGFFVLLIIVVLGGWLIVQVNPMKNQGAMSWAEMYSEDPAATLFFLNRTLGVRVANTTKTPDGMIYNVIRARRQIWPFAGVMGLPRLPDGEEIAPGTIIYLTVRNYAAAHEAMIEHGAVAHQTGLIAEGMKFGIYTIPGGVTIGIAQYGVKE